LLLVLTRGASVFSLDCVAARVLSTSRK
ncbi:MAG: DoxX family protein, partial [Mesorhizobium sp.]